MEYINDNEAIKYKVKINNGPVKGNNNSSILDVATKNAFDNFMVDRYLYNNLKSKHWMSSDDIISVKFNC